MVGGLVYRQERDRSGCYCPLQPALVGTAARRSGRTTEHCQSDVCCICRLYLYHYLHMYLSVLCTCLLLLPITSFNFQSRLVGTPVCVALAQPCFVYTYQLIQTLGQQQGWQQVPAIGNTRYLPACLPKKPIAKLQTDSSRKTDQPCRTTSIFTLCFLL